MGRPDVSIREAEDLFIAAVGGAIEFWGFRRILGNVWAWLYLAAEPRSAKDLCERLGISKAAASMALAELERWGCVHRLRRPGGRRELFAAEHDVWRMVSRVFRERELRRIDLALDDFERARRLLKDSPGRESAERSRARVALSRIDQIASLARLARASMLLVLERGRADVRPLRSGAGRSQG